MVVAPASSDVVLRKDSDEITMVGFLSLHFSISFARERVSAAKFTLPLICLS